MRVTNTLFYTNAANNYQNNMQELFKVNAQISSGLKIQNSFDDSGIFVDTMRLNYEIATLEQVKESSSKAQAFANNTDSVLSHFTESLNVFKTKIIQASSQVHSSVSLNAIADELESLRANMITLGNTSINGEFLFSGNATSIKPISNDGSYNGNDKKREVVIGSSVKLPYNIDGQELFLGVDSSRSRVVSTNVQMFNQSMLHPDTMVLDSGVTDSQRVYLTQSDSIRDMVGDFDSNSLNDPNTMFYISGRKSNGDTFSEKIEMRSYEKVSELLEKIGSEFGNSTTNTVVEVNMNEHGQIEIKDLRIGGQLLEFNIFGAVDRDALSGTIGDASQMSVDNLLRESNVQIIEFQTTNFKSANTAAQINTRQDIFNPGVFKLGAPMTTKDGSPVSGLDTLQSFMGTTINQISFSGNDNSGTPILLPPSPNDVLTVNSATTVQEMVSKIGSIYGVSARLEDGQIYLEGGSSSDFTANRLNALITASDSIGVSEVQSISIREDAASTGNITIAGVNITITAGDTPTNIALNIAASITAAGLPHTDTSGNDILSVGSNGGEVFFTYDVANGDVADVAIANPIGLNMGSVITERNYASARIVDVFSTLDAMNYERRGFEKEGNTLTSNVLQIVKETNEFADSSTKLSEVSGVRSLHGTTLDFNFTNIDGNMSKGRILLQDTGSFFQVDFDNSATYEPNEKIDLFDTTGAATRANNVTYQQILDVLTLALSGNHPVDKDEFDPTTGANLGPDGNLFDEYKLALNSSTASVSATMDHRGRIKLTDSRNSDTKMTLALFDSRSDSYALSSDTSAFSFMANDAIKIADPAMDFYKDLELIVQAVRKGEFQMSSENFDSRSLGLNNSLTKIDHLMHHINRSQAKIGAFSNALQQANERSQLLSINIQTIRSEVIDTDMGEAYMRFTQLSNSYQAMLSTVAKINSMSLLNYM